eukprot:9636165-Alexandrium_andersonii.AAC.1
MARSGTAVSRGRGAGQSGGADACSVMDPFAAAPRASAGGAGGDGAAPAPADAGDHPCAALSVLGFSGHACA